MAEFDRRPPAADRAARARLLLTPTQLMLPMVRCEHCGADARLLAYDRGGEPMVACTTPGCRGHWEAQVSRPREPST
ncbi:MAG: hypothetical protein QM765_03845 [Myxococcales bacterium]